MATLAIARPEGAIDRARAPAVPDRRIVPNLDTLDDAREAADLPAQELSLHRPLPAAVPAT